MTWKLLASVREEERQRLLALARRRTFRRDEVVVHRGDPADTMHLISKGRFAVQIVTPFGHTAILAVLGPGESFGELALISSDPRRSATVIALEPGETRSVHQLDFDALRARHPAVSEVMVALLAQQVHRLSGQVVEALYVDADRRVLRRLDDLAATYGAGEGPVDVPLTQEMIAGLSGTSRATVNRVLREAEREGVVRLGRGRVTVLDTAGLGRLAGRRET